MIVEKTIHQGYTEYQNYLKNHKVKQDKNNPFLIPIQNHFGKYQYFYTSGNKRISLIFLKVCGDSWWEIFAYENKELFEDTERFKTKKEAVKRITELLK